jgi:hypothetical protein
MRERRRRMCDLGDKGKQIVRTLIVSLGETGSHYRVLSRRWA